MTRPQSSLYDWGWARSKHAKTNGQSILFHFHLLKFLSIASLIFFFRVIVHWDLLSVVSRVSQLFSERYIVIHRFSYVQSVVNTFLHHSFCQLFSYPVNRAIIETICYVQSTWESIGKSKRDDWGRVSSKHAKTNGQSVLFHFHLLKFLFIAFLIFFFRVIAHWDLLLPFTLCAFLSAMDKLKKQNNKKIMLCRVANLKKNISDYSSTGHGNSYEKQQRAVNQKE